MTDAFGLSIPPMSRDAESDRGDSFSNVLPYVGGSTFETHAVVSGVDPEHRLRELAEEIQRLQQVVCELLLANQQLRFIVAQYEQSLGKGTA
jgi:hypothetical protein